MLKMKCIYCEKEETKNIEGEYVCSECLERDFTICSDCEAWIHNADIRTVRRNREGYEVYVCEHCYEQIERGA